MDFHYESEGVLINRYKIILLKTVLVLIIIFYCLLNTTTNVFAKRVLIDGILAVVNQEIITFSDLINREKRLYDAENPPDGMSAEARMSIRKKILQDLIDGKLMVNEARRLNLTPSNEELLEYLNKIKISNNINSDEELEAFLAKEGLTIEELKGGILEEISIIKVREHMVYRNVDVNEKEILEFYDSNWTGHKEGLRVKISHILLKFDEGNRPEYEKSLLEKCNEILHKWEQGESFTELVAEYSEDVSADSGGTLGMFYLKDLRPEFAEAIKNLEPGNISKPIKTELGYHILLLEERKDSGLETGSSIWNKIAETIYEKKKANFYETWIQRLRKEADIEINQGALD